MKRQAVVRTLFLAASCAVAACSGAHDDNTRGAPESSGADANIEMTRDQIARAGIGWEAASPVVATDTIEVPGQLAPNEDRTARLSASSRARVQAVHIHMGEEISRGQLLVTLVSEEAAAARAQNTRAVAELQAQRVAARFARTALDRAERLLELKAVSRQDVEKARVDFETAEARRLDGEAEVERTQAVLMQLGVVSARGEMAVRSPLTGVVLSRDVVPGSVVNAGDPLVTVSDLGTLWLDIAATGRAAIDLRPGRRVAFTVPELPSQVFDGTIEDIGAALDPATRTLPLHAIVENRRRLLRPAMFAAVTVPIGDPRSGVAVPDGAVQLLDARPVVFVARPHGGGARFERRAVDVGGRTEHRVHLLNGIEPGEVIVTSGAYAVKSVFARAKMPVD